MDSTKISCSNMHSSPLLMFFIQDQSKVCLFNLRNMREYELKMNLEKNRDWRFLGSSHGWLLLLNEKADPVLMNMFSGISHQLPGKETLPHIHSLQEVGDDVFEIHHKSVKTLGQLFVVKAILSANPSSDKNFAVVLMYNGLCRTKLAFCRPGDSGWTRFGGEIQSYYDVVCTDNVLYALGTGPSIEAWDLHELAPTRKIIIQTPCPRKLAEAYKIFPSDLYSSQWYLTFSSGEMLFVVRYIGEFVRYDGEVVYEGDILTDNASEPLICPYRTVQFHVYKLDFDQKIWLPIESLNEYALFLGGNQSVLLPAKEHPGCKSNAIYFTDDYWDRMDEDYSYGGHDMGIFKLEDGSIEPLFNRDHQRIEPTPFWIVPN